MNKQLMLITSFLIIALFVISACQRDVAGRRVFIKEKTAPIDNGDSGAYGNGAYGYECTLGQTRQCGSTGVGVCEYGTQICKAGQWMPCVGNIEPSSEICNNLDDDCDGLIDEECIQCKDSDGGLNYKVKGTIEGLMLGDYIEDSDYCFILDQRANFCSGTACALYEYYCASDTVVGRTPNSCQYGCRDGACYFCGNNIIEGTEICDGTNITHTCESIGYNEGTLFCKPDCNDYNTCDCVISSGGECCSDVDCDDEDQTTIDKCINQNDINYGGHSVAECIYTSQLMGNLTLNTLVIEFSPQDIVYGNFYYCYNDILGYYIQTLEQFCDNQISSYSFLDLLNNRNKILTFNPLNEYDERNYYSLFYINDYLLNEADKYGITEIPYFNISLVGPFILNDLPPQTTNFAEIDSYFNNKVNEFDINIQGYDIIYIIYFNDYDVLSDVDKHKFTSHTGDNKIYISADTFRILSSLYPHVMIHELLHLFGANDYYIHGETDQNDWCSVFQCCTDPEGVPEPGNYPQTNGCLMCAEGSIVIELGLEQQSPQNSIEDVVVCQKTAEEIGWFDS